MIVKIEKGTPKGVFYAPPSKSYAHRLLILGALAGNSEISGVGFSEDIKSTLSCLSSLGFPFGIKGDTVVFGKARTAVKKAELFCGESGSTLRFMIPVALSFGGEFLFNCSERLVSRGIGEYEKIFGAQGVEFKIGKDFILIKGKISPERFEIRGDVSSQFATGLLFALAISGGGEIKPTAPLLSRPYVDITIDCLKKFGVSVKEKDGVFSLGEEKELKSAAVKVEGDYSNAAFLDAFSVLGADVSVTGLDENSVQGDRAYKKLFSEIKKGYLSCDLSDTPDLAPVCFALAGASRGGKFTGTARLKIKESDRAEVMKEELSAFGITLIVREDETEVVPPKNGLLKPYRRLSSHNDHRIAMALSVLLTLTGGELSGAEAVKKSYPEFFEILKEHGVKIESETLQ